MISLAMTDTTFSYEDIRKMRRGTNTYDVFTFPFTDNIFIWMRVLTQDEMIRAGNKGKLKAKKIYWDIAGGEDNAFAVRELLYMAVVRATSDTESTSEPFFSSPEDVWELSLDELTILDEHYKEIQRKYTPFVDAKTPEEFEALIADLKKKPQIGMSLSTDTLRLLVAYLTVNSQTLQNDSESTYLPVNQSETIEKNQPMTKELRGIKVLESLIE